MSRSVNLITDKPTKYGAGRPSYSLLRAAG